MSPDFSFANPDDKQVKTLLTNMKRIAVVGISAKEDRASHGIARFLVGQGFDVVGVNPVLKEPVLGMKIYPSLKDVPDQVDVVNIFRRSDQVGPIVDAAIERGDSCVWLQEQVINPEAAQKATQAGLDVLMDVCLYKEWLRLMNG
ncbi:MAG: CoA-binding protein [bacterium]|nr:CoA-binding protein [bacterium]